MVMKGRGGQVSVRAKILQHDRGLGDEMADRQQSSCRKLAIHLHSGNADTACFSRAYSFRHTYKASATDHHNCPTRPQLTQMQRLPKSCVYQAEGHKSAWNGRCDGEQSSRLAVLQRSGEIGKNARSLVDEVAINLCASTNRHSMVEQM